MQNSFQAKQDIIDLLDPSGPLGLDLTGALQAQVQRKEAETQAAIEAQRASQEGQQAEATVAADKAIMSGASTPGQPFEAISPAEIAKAESVPVMPRPSLNEEAEAAKAEFESAVEAESPERELRKAAGDDAIPPEVASPTEAIVRQKGDWKDSGLPGSNLFETSKDAAEYFLSIGDEMSAAIASGQNPKGLVETTSPVEFAVTGMGALGAMAVNQARRATGKYLGGYATKTYARYMKSFAAGSPVEFAATIGAEEIAEDHPFVGIAAEVLFGVGTGVVADLATGAFTPRLADTVTEAVEEVVKEKFSRAEKDAYYSSYAYRTMRYSDRAVIPEMNLTAKQVDSALASLKADVAKGDLRDPDTREVYSRAIAKAQGAGMSPEASGAAASLEAKISAIAAGSPVNPDNPAASAASALVSPDMPSIPKDSAADRLDALAPKSEVIRPAEAVSELGQKIRASKYRAVRDKIKASWYGPKNEDFTEDVVGLFNAQLKAARVAGTPISGKAAKQLYADIEAGVRRQYDEAIDSEAWKRIQQIEATPWVSQLRAGYVRGLSGAEDRYEVAPGSIIRREQRVGDTTSPYQYKDWDITDHLVFTKDGTGIVLQSDMPNQVPLPAAEKVIPPKFVPAINYPAAVDRASVMNMLASKFKYWGSPQRKVFHGRGVRPDFPAADRLKVDTEVWDQASNSYIMVKALPDSEIEAIAKLYGWNDSRVTGYTYQDSAPSRISSDHVDTTVNLLPEDVLRGKNAFDEMEVTNPGWFDKQKKSEGEKDAKFYLMSGALQAYKAQRTAFLKQMFDVTAQRMGEGESNKYYNSMVERIAVMRNDILKDIKVLEGTNYGPYAKRTYLAFGDMLAGTNRLGLTTRLSENQVRTKALWEYEQFTRKGPTDAEKIDTAIAQRMEDAGESYDEAAEFLANSEIYSDAAQAGQVADIAGVPMGGRIIDTNIEGPISKPRERSTGPASFEGIGRVVLDLDDDALNAKVIYIEDHFGVRFADDLWDASAAGGSGKLNIWRINTLDDINGLFMRLDKPITQQVKGKTITTTIKSAAPLIDIGRTFGLEASTKHSADMVQRIALVMKDVVQQMDQTAKGLASNPADLPAAVAWAKLRGIYNLMASSLTGGKASKASIEALGEMNLYGNSNTELLARVMEVTNKVMPLDSTGAPSAIGLAANAEMFNDLHTHKLKAGLLKRFNDLESPGMTNLYKEQRRLHTLLTEGCNK